MRRMQREMEDLFGNLPTRRWPLTTDYPPVNIVRAENTLTVEALCPGVDRDSFDITVVGNALTIRCERKPPPDVPAEHYHRRERPVGTFTRTISVGERFDPDRTEANYSEGILRLALSRAPEATPKKIAIQS